MSNRERVVLNGRYELQRRVGRGGMAEVYLAHDSLLDRPVAIKILFPEFATDPSFVARFRREAQSAANLSHPNIVGVYDWGKERGTYYIVMEYIDGQSVSELLRADGPIPAKRAAQIAADVAGALGSAHQKDVVHRDVKPGNILITKDGEVKVADFGIARAMTATSEENLTQTGSVMGTATYFSPEQAQGKPVDARSDLYSLGVVLYEMACGKPPFQADSPVAIAYKHVQEPLPSLREKVPDIPPDYEAVTVKALAKEPDDRYRNGAEMRADLLRVRDGRPVNAPPVGAAVPLRPPRPRTGQVPRTSATGAVPVRPRQQVAPAPKRTGWFFAAILVLLALLGVMLFLFARTLGIFDDTPKQVAVVRVIGMTQAEAERELKGLGLEVDVEMVESDEPAGQVVAQDPGEGENVDEGSTVTIEVSAEIEMKVMSDVSQMTVPAARARLIADGFDGDNITEEYEPSDQPIGTVISQTPEPGLEYPADQAIVLLVSSEPLTTTTEEPAPTTTAPPPVTTTEPPPPVTTTTAAPPPPTTTTAPPPTTTTAAPEPEEP